MHSWGTSDDGLPCDSAVHAEGSWKQQIHNPGIGKNSRILIEYLNSNNMTWLCEHSKTKFDRAKNSHFSFPRVLEQWEQKVESPVVWWYSHSIVNLKSSIITFRLILIENGPTLTVDVGFIIDEIEVGKVFKLKFEGSWEIVFTFAARPLRKMSFEHVLFNDIDSPHVG